MKVQEVQAYLSQLFEKLQQERKNQEPLWLQKARQEAFESLTSLGFPSSSDEGWRFTNPGIILPYLSSCAFSYREQSSLSIPFSFRDKMPELCFINGFFSPEHSFLSALPEGLEIVTFQEMLLEKKLTATFEHQPFAREFFAALNGALFQEALFVKVKAGKALPVPVHFLFLTDQAEPGSSYPRLSIFLEKESKASFIFSFISLGEANCFGNSVFELFLDEGSTLAHSLFQEEGKNLCQVNSFRVYQGAGSSYRAQLVTFGTVLLRNNYHVLLEGQGAFVDLSSLFLTYDKNHLDNQTLIVHSAPHTTSEESFKGILDGASKAVFQGKIAIQQGASASSAHQQNKNLLLSDKAVIHTQPHLQIDTDDVRCSHGATIGQLDREALFYLCSRGFAVEQARALLLHAFAGEILAKISCALLRKKIGERLSSFFSRKEVLHV